MTVSELPSRAATAALSPPWDRRRVALTALSVVAVVATALSLHSVRFSPIEFVRGLAESGYFGRAFPPVWEDLGSSLRELWRTFVMAAAGTALAAVMAVPVGLLAARNISPWGWTAWLGRTIITACRAVPDFVFAIFFVTALSIGELPGVLALGFHSIGMLGKLLADAIEEDRKSVV